MKIHYVVQGFEVGKRGRVVPSVPIEARDEASAYRTAVRLSDRKVGVMIVSRKVDTETGAYDDPVLLASYGEVPDDALAALNA